MNSRAAATSFSGTSNNCLRTTPDALIASLSLLILPARRGRGSSERNREHWMYPLTAMCHHLQLREPMSRIHHRRILKMFRGLTGVSVRVGDTAEMIVSPGC